MLNHHPDLSLLSEYAGGSIDWGLSLAVATHLHFCPECRSRVQELTHIGSCMLTHVKPVAVRDDAIDRLLNRVAGAGDPEGEVKVSTASTHSPLPEKVEKPSPAKRRDAMLQNLPRVVEKLLPRNKPLRWKFVSPALRMARLSTGQNKYEVAFHKIGVGGKVAEHDHKGLEITIVLKGSFSDGDGVYNEGDFLVRHPGDVHRPTAAQNQDCLCFSVVEAPVQLTGLLGKILNPLLSVKPM